jgi:hypothetical protein
MRHSKQRRGADSSRPRARSGAPSDPTTSPEVGDQFIGPSGRIWTIQSIAARAGRIVLTRPTDDGPASSVVDYGALAMMARIDPMPAAVPVTGFAGTSLRPGLTVPTLRHVTRDRQTHRGCHRRRVLIHLTFDESHHAHLDTYESIPV